MTFKAKLKCDVEGCYQEIDLDCSDPNDADDVVLDSEDDYGWFVDLRNDRHYCHRHAQYAKSEYEKRNQSPTGIMTTMVG